MKATARLAILGSSLATMLMPTACALHAAAEPALTTTDLPFPLIERFENFTERDGIPGHKVHAVLKGGDGRLWVGTYEGLCVRQPDGKFKRFGPEDGLSHKLVLCLAEDSRTGDLWVGTARGLNRFSGGQFTTYTQTDSGLPNNVVYGVAVVGDTVWAATAAGTGAYHTRSGTWKIYDQNNSIMHEPWCYAIAPAKDVLYIGVWGGGIVEHNPATGSFKEYRDPDGDFQFVLTPDSGPVSDITAWLAWEDGLLWQGTYFGLSRYDGSRWRTWVETKSPLVSNFINFVATRRTVAWVGTDRGVSVTDGNDWVNYLLGSHREGILEIHRPSHPVERRVLQTALVNAFVLGIWVDDREAWFATSDGLSRGILSRKNPDAPVAQLGRSASHPGRGNNIPKTKSYEYTHP
ncbi:MAG: hypothetical protein KGS61_17520 [Verrucomicrobia bacterium]|nr:hypothetical protein [Verrucomicrobiota bacterium]